MHRVTNRKESIRKKLLIAAAFLGLLPFTITHASADPVPVDPTLKPYQTGPMPHKAAPAKQQPATADDRKNETLISAQHMNSDQNTGIVTATGKVEIARSGYLLHADKVTFNQKTNVMHAEGHVAILAPTGEVEFAEKEEITGDMKQAFAENISILFPDNSRFAAKNAQRYDGRYTLATQGTYTACNVCKQNPDNPPLWELRGKTIVHDNEEHEIYYHDATIDFAGVPVLYTPYFSAPDPTVDRRQGFLAPTPGVTPDIGPYIRVPYYFDISPESDAIFAPTFSTKDHVQLGGEYRRRFENGNLQIDGSFTRADLTSDTGTDEGQQWRGHMFGTFLYNIDNVWRAGTDVNFTSDKSYLERYHISSDDELTSRAYVEGFKGRNYMTTQMYYFEDLRPGTNPVQPLVLPEVQVNMLGEPGKTFGGRWSFDGNMLVTSRDNANQNLTQQGPDTRRISVNGGWERQFTSDTGLVITPSALWRGNAYWADNVINPNGSGSNFNNVVLARQFEQANVVARYPMGRNGDGYQQLVEPIVAITAAPRWKPTSNQPLEDSLDVEFDETNLFSPNRFTGDDLIEGGSRATYGIRHAITTNDGMRVDMFGGQSYDFTRNDAFPEQSGLQDHESDWVGRIDFIPAKWLDANYGFRLDHRNFSPQRQDAVISAGAPVFRPYVQYVSAYQTETTGIVDQDKEATFGFSSLFAKYWTLSGAHTQAFAPQPGPRNSNISLSYADECFVFGITASHTDTNRVDISSGTSVMFHFFLKNLGGIHTDSPSKINYPAEFRQY
ncbi:MAG TPA: LPS assembly protein LptD [Alphaproteobacteria bacterium]|nr:LPS assembly protein LptD [Alphaproteobacteria bacterium]